MSANTPETPRETNAPEALQIEEWLGPKNARSLIHLDRKIILEAVRDRRARVEPLVATLGGFGLFKAYEESAECTVLVTNHTKIAGERNTVVTVNRLRQPTPDEEVFPDGRVLDLLDVTIPSQSRWLNTARGRLYRGQHEHRWPDPLFATLLQPRNEHLRLIGNLEDSSFTPCPAKDMIEVHEDAIALWEVHTALAHCHEANLCDGITSITTPK